MAERFYMVTFDIVRAFGREADYRKVEDALKFRFGEQNHWKFIKQCQFIQTSSSPQAVCDLIRQKLGSSCNLLVIRVSRRYAFKLINATKRAEAKDFFDRMSASQG